MIPTGNCRELLLFCIPVDKQIAAPSSQESLQFLYDSDWQLQRVVNTIHAPSSQNNRHDSHSRKCERTYEREDDDSEQAYKHGGPSAGSEASTNLHILTRQISPGRLRRCKKSKDYWMRKASTKTMTGRINRPTPGTSTAKAAIDDVAKTVPNEQKRLPTRFSDAQFEPESTRITSSESKSTRSRSSSLKPGTEWSFLFWSFFKKRESGGVTCAPTF
mmetsp:Transcript_30613/g.50654  ORF Transcript_30613/g.50654 Transcript_30613/m.50654 type:complete len:217 (+) Transcript_30613:119-769(+)